MKKKKGNLITMALEDKFDVIIHGCNCFCTMGAGIARSIKAAYPEAYQADLATKAGDRSKLGTISYALCNGVWVVNAYTQYRYGRGMHTDYDAISKAFKLIASKTKPGKRIGYPAIGAGLGGGNWNIISEIIDKEFEGLNHTLVRL